MLTSRSSVVKPVICHGNPHLARALHRVACGRTWNVETCMGWRAWARRYQWNPSIVALRAKTFPCDHQAACVDTARKQMLDGALVTHVHRIWQRNQTRRSRARIPRRVRRAWSQHIRIIPSPIATWRWRGLTWIPCHTIGTWLSREARFPSQIGAPRVHVIAPILWMMPNFPGTVHKTRDIWWNRRRAIRVGP